MRNKKVLITGATGFLGFYVVKEFLENKYEVISIGRNEDKGKELECLGSTFLKGDFTKKESLENLLKEESIDYIVHCGALSTIWGKWEEFYSSNVNGLKNILEIAMEKKVKRFIFVSSPSIYSGKDHRLNIKEEEYSKDNELNFYIKTKILGEEIIREFYKKGLYTVIIRPRGLFGIGDTSIVPRLLKANKKIGIPLFNEGSNLVDMTHVSNVALALRLSCEKKEIRGEVFNITNNEPMEFKVILDKVFEEINEIPHYRKADFKKFYFIGITLEKIYKVFNLGGEPPITGYIVCTLGTSQTLDIKKAKNKLGYVPKISIYEGIKEYGKWYRECNKRD